MVADYIVTELFQTRFALGDSLQLGHPQHVTSTAVFDSVIKLYCRPEYFTSLCLYLRVSASCSIQVTAKHSQSFRIYISI